jgi:hypothetical protein
LLVKRVLNLEDAFGGKIWIEKVKKE